MDERFIEAAGQEKVEDADSALLDRPRCGCGGGVCAREGSEEEDEDEDRDWAGEVVADEAEAVDEGMLI